MKHRPLVVIIRDGWGENHDSEYDSLNAVKRATTPVSDRIRVSFPRTEIAACGENVGLPRGVVGNSEVGHQNIGAGRVVSQEIVRITQAFSEGQVRENPVMGACFERLRMTGGKLHLMGLASNAGVHSSLEHLYELLLIASREPVNEVLIHAFMDGRDTSPFSGVEFIKQIEEKCRAIGVGRIATVCGRYWSMDRDERWERVEKAHACLTGLRSEATATSAADAVQQYYDCPLDDYLRGDEFVNPTWIVDDQERPVGVFEDGDSVIFFNFRGDRPRELTRALIDPNFDHFPIGGKMDLFYVTMTEYEKGLCQNVLFRKPPAMANTLGSYISDLGMYQFRCAETEKYPHVTFFFNDYRDEPFPGEDRELIPSPRNVQTYDQKPEMSALGVCRATVEAIRSRQYDFILVNFANPDMVGHTGSLDATIVACENVDYCLGEILEALDRVGGRAIITADHGNSDQMWDPKTEGPHTAHTLNPVEFIVYGSGCDSIRLRKGGRLADIAPTVLALMGIKIPVEMTGTSLLEL